MSVIVTAEALGAVRPRLLVFCYQLLGSPFDAEDAVQDTLERAWRSRNSFDPDLASLSTWTFRIARNVCFDRLRERPRRALPRDLSDPGIEVGSPLVPAPEVPWLLPAPTSWWEDSGPEQSLSRMETMRLVVTALLQALPPRQRGVFVLRDGLGLSAAETAAALEMSPSAVNSALQRARAAVRQGTSRPARLQAGVVERYAGAIERGDVAELSALVADDVLFEMPPVPHWSIGRETYADFMTHLLSDDSRTWTTKPLSANGQPGILLFVTTDAGPQPHTVQLFAGSDGGSAIGHVLVYRDAELFALFADDSFRSSDESSALQP